MTKIGKLARHRKWLLIAIPVVLVIGLTTAYFGGLWALERRAVGWRNDGVAASIAGDHDKAVSLLGRYLQRRPDDEQAYTRALGCYLNSLEHCDPPRFGPALEAAKQLVGRTDSLEDRRHLLRLYVNLDRHPEAIDAADGILSRKEWANDAETLGLKFATLTALSRNREAMAVAEAWSQAAPLEVKAHMAVLSTGARNGRTAESVIKYATDLLAKHPADARFEFLLGYAFGLFTDDATSAVHAAESLKTAAAHIDLPEDLTQLILEQFDTLGMPDESMTLLQAMVSRGAGSSVRYAFARRCWELGRWSSTAELLTELNPTDPAADPTLLAMRAISLANLNKPAESAAIRSGLATRKQVVAQAWTLLLRRIIDGATVDDTEVITKCKASLAADSTNPYLANYLGDAEYRSMELDLAAQAWRAAAARDPAWGVPATKLVEVLLRQGHPEEASWVAYDTFRRTRSAGSAVAMAQAYASTLNAGGSGMADELFKMTTDILQKIPGEESTQLIHVRLLAQRNDKPAAIESARQAIVRTPAPREAFFLAMAKLSRQFALGVEQECFSRTEQAHGLTADLALGRAVDHLLGTTPNAAAGLTELEQLAKRSGRSADWEWQLARARYLDMTTDPGAKAAWVALGNAFPDSLPVQIALANARAVAGDWDIGQKTIDRLHHKSGDAGLDWRLAKARLMVESARSDADYEQGSLLLNKVIQEFPSLTEPRVLLALALVQMKRVDGAIEQLSTAAKLDPFSVPISLQLAALLQSRGDFERVQNVLDHVTQQAHSGSERRQAAILMAQQGNTKSAVHILETAQTQPSQGSGDSDNLLLAVMYRRSGQLEKCDALLAHLLDQQNVSFPIIQFAASHFGARGRNADAQAVLAKLDSLKLDPGISELTRGSYCAQQGDMAGALKYYQAATEHAPQNPVAWQLLAITHAAAGHMDSALATADRALAALPDDARMKVIHAQAEVLRRAGDAIELRPIVLLIFRDPASSELSVELLGWMIDAQSTNNRGLLISRLGQMIERHPDFLPAQIQLVNALANMGRREEALAAAQHAITAFTASPEPAAKAAQLCAAWGRWNEMEAAANTWHKRAPEDPAADVAIARAAIGLRNYDSALAQLRPYLHDALANPDQFTELIFTYCMGATQAGQVPAAAEVLWPLAQKSDQWRRQWVEIGIGIDEPSQAASWLQRVDAVMPENEYQSRTALAEAWEVLGVRSGNARFSQQAAASFAKMAIEPGVTGLALAAAGAAAERRSDPSAAEQLYQRALKLDPGLWTAQNNLAGLITERGGDLKEATSHAIAAVRLEPHQANIRDTLAEVLAKAGDFRAAADAERIASQLEPLNAEWRVRLAEYLLDSKDATASAQIVGELENARLDFRQFPPGKQKMLTEKLATLRKRLRQGA